MTSHSHFLIPNPCFQTFSGGFAAPKGSQPRLAALGSPFQGKGLAWIHPPSYGRRCPEEAEVGWGKRYEKERGRSSQVRRLREYPIHRCAVPLPLEGKVASGASRLGFSGMKDKWERLSQVRRLRKYPSAAQKRKPTPPRCARQPLPREGARVDTPSFLWKEVPRRGGGWMGGEAR